MITTINLVNIYHYSYDVFLMTRTFKMHSLINFQIYNTALLTVVTMLFL